MLTQVFGNGQTRLTALQFTLLAEQHLNGTVMPYCH
jgi:hypothetical protein